MFFKKFLLQKNKLQFYSFYIGFYMLQLQFSLHSFQYTEFPVRVFINTATTVCLNLVALV